MSQIEVTVVGAVHTQNGVAFVVQRGQPALSCNHFRPQHNKVSAPVVAAVISSYNNRDTCHLCQMCCRYCSVVHLLLSLSLSLSLCVCVCVRVFRTTQACRCFSGIKQKRCYPNIISRCDGWFVFLTSFSYFTMSFRILPISPMKPLLKQPLQKSFKNHIHYVNKKLATYCFSDLFNARNGKAAVRLHSLSSCHSSWLKLFVARIMR